MRISDWSSDVCSSDLPLSLGANDSAAGTEYTDLAAIFHFHANAISLAGLGVENGHIGNVDGHGLVDDAALRARHGVTLDVLLDNVDTFDQHMVGVNTLQYGAAALFVATGQYNDFVAFTDFFHDGLLTALLEPATRSS